MCTIFKFLYVEDDLDMIEAMADSIVTINEKTEKGNKFQMQVVSSSSDALLFLDKYDFDFVLIDIKLHGGDSGNIVIDKIKKDYKIPCAILSGTPDTDDGDLIKIFTKSNCKNHEILEEMASEVGLFKVIGKRGIIDANLQKLFWDNFYKDSNYWKRIKDSLTDRSMEQLVLRYTISHLYELLDYESEQYETIEMFINPYIYLEGIKTGTVVQETQDLANKNFIVLSPPCDLAIRSDDVPKTDSVLLVEIENYSVHIKHRDDLLEPSKAFKKDIGKLVKNNHSDNLYWLSNYFDIFSGGFVNFRKIKTESFENLSDGNKYKKIIKLQDNFVKSLLSKFSIYYNRQGQPDFNFEKVTDEIANKFVGSEN